MRLRRTAKHLNQQMILFFSLKNRGGKVPADVRACKGVGGAGVSAAYVTCRLYSSDARCCCRAIAAHALDFRKWNAAPAEDGAAAKRLSSESHTSSSTYAGEDCDAGRKAEVQAMGGLCKGNRTLKAIGTAHSIAKLFAWVSSSSAVISSRIGLNAGSGDTGFSRAF